MRAWKISYLVQVPMQAIALVVIPSVPVWPALTPAPSEMPMLIAQERLGGISRRTLRRMLELGEGMTEQGYFVRPIPVHEIYPNFTRGNGSYEQPLSWDPENSIVFGVRDGYIVWLEYRFGGGSG